ncbi:MAG: response regulator [Spirochaetales bacterium]|nr:response regulator [Spirochaetales bacterium]
MNTKLTIQNKLFSGFIAILALAGFAGIVGILGIASINKHNEIDIVIDELAEKSETAQEAALRYIIYEDSTYHDTAVNTSSEVLNLAIQLHNVVKQKGILQETDVLIADIKEYRELLKEYKKKENRLLEAQSTRQQVGVDVITMTEEVITSLEDNYSKNNSNTYKSISNLRKLLSTMNSYRSTAYNYSQGTTPEEKEIIFTEWIGSLNKTFEGYNSLESDLAGHSEIYSIQKIIASLQNYILQVKNYHDATIKILEHQDTQRNIAKKLISQISILRLRLQEENTRTTLIAGTTIKICLGIAIVFSFIIALLLSRSITIPLQKGVSVAQNIAEGKLENASMNLTRKDEIGELGEALDKMTHSLLVQRWLERGKQGLDDELRGEVEVKSLSEKFIRYITVHMNACMGAFYLFDGEDILELCSSYAFTDRAGNFNKIKVGEGFIGQAAKEQQTLFFSKINEAPGYNYGAGEDVPDHFMVSPLIFEDELIAVFLIGTFKDFDDDQKKFIKNNVENIAVLFNSAKSRDTINMLLIDSKQQQEELRAINEELENQTTALKESQAELQAQQEELRVMNEELEERTQAVEEQRDSIRQKNEALLEARSELEKRADDLGQASQYKSEFLANMSHELRTPLNSILILAQLLSNNGEGNLTEKQLKSAKAIHSSGSDLLKLINEILDLSKVEAGKIELNLETVSFASIIDDLKRLFSESASQKGLELNISFDSQLPDKLKTDSHRLQQIIRNLMTNAIKFTDKGYVSLSFLKPDKPWQNLTDDQYFLIKVSDTGVGIAKEKQDEIFEAFKQADGSTIRKYGGTGLGLSISRGLSKLLGGVITLESEEGKGSCFTVTLPLLTSEEKVLPKPVQQEYKEPIKPEPAPAPSLPQTKEKADAVDDRNNVEKDDKTILIIEDDPSFVEILSELVKEKGYKTLIAEDGETGLHFADYYNPDAIILDIGLPGIDGWTVMERLKANSKLRHIPVHFMSGRDEALQAMRMGAVGFLTKPASIEDIHNALTKIESMSEDRISTLLVVEDDDIQRESIIELIGEDDVKITDVSSGQKAFETLKTNKFDCMILDLGLKDMSGFELLEKINNDVDCIRTPIIIYTGRELTKEDEAKLNKYSKSIIIKGIRSPERLLDETTLFLHKVESSLPEDKRRMLENIHNGDEIMEGKKILLVDDDMRNVFALTSILEEKKLNVLAARDGIEALEKIKSEPGINLVLMDIMMPRMDGYEAMRRIRKDHQFKNLPIIALTAKAMKGDRNKCIEAGASDYLAKPVDTEKLLSMLRVWLYS